MKFLRDVKQRIANSKWFGKLKKVKNLEIVIAVALAAVAIVIYVALSFCGSGKRPTEPQIQMTEKEARVARMISEIAGVGEARVLITGEDNAVVPRQIERARLRSVWRRFAYGDSPAEECDTTHRRLPSQC